MNGFERFKLKYSESNMYLLVDGDQALIIDPNQSEDALLILNRSKVRHIDILLTHEHFDHISGVNWLRKLFDTTVICQQKCAESISIAKNNRPFVFMSMVENISKQEKKEIISFYDAMPADEIKADIVFDDEYEFSWQGHHLKLKSCPGHSKGSMLILFDDEYVFTGDYMIPDVPVILRFSGGSKEEYKNKTLPVLLNLSTELMIMPGHGEAYRRGAMAYKHGCFMNTENSEGE